ncbi:MAG: hypothetical protein WKF59_13525 [Chitinophagaceae bacterium]
MSYNIFRSDKDFYLESGSLLPGFHLAYTTQGILNEKKDNVIWIFHALTANSVATEWWHGLIGEGNYLILHIILSYAQICLEVVTEVLVHSM